MKRNSKGISIKNYINLNAVSLLAVSLLICMLAFLLLYQCRQRQRLVDDMRIRSDDISEVLAASGMDEAMNENGLGLRIENVAEYQNGRLMIISRRYRVIRDTMDDISGAYLISSDVMNVMKGGESLTYEKDDRVIIISPIHGKDGNNIGVIISTASLESIRNDLVNLLKVCLVVVLVVFLGGFFVCRYISGRVAFELADLNEKMAYVASGNLQEHLPEQGFSELRELTENYNEVLSKLSTIDQTRSEFVSNVSHELKTPITSMKVLAESLVQNESATAEEYKEFMTDIVDEIDRETQIINDLLTLVRTDSNKAEMNFEEVDINEMMETIVKTVNPLAMTRGIDLSYESFKDVTAEVDQVKLSLAISNLIENAVKYNVDSGWIKCSLNADHKYFYIKIADSGVGIPEDEKDKVFERFYRVDKARSRDTGGTGLGLSITRSIINSHKGSIKLYSESGKGTTFTVKIPLKQ